MKLHQAAHLAEQIRDALAPFCDQIAIAGSIRRARPEVNDIDLVVQPKPGQEQALRERCLVRCGLISDGQQILSLNLPQGFQLDLFFAHPRETDLLGETTPGNWGSVLLCRTGSKEHNIRIAQAAGQLGLHWNPNRGLMVEGNVIASETEEDIFQTLGMQFVPPVLREA